MKKYELASEAKVECGVTLHQIRALVDIERYGVKAGDLGGWIESEANLDHKSEAWVSGEAQVFGEARVFGKARVSKTDHVLTVGPIGSRDGTTTFFRAKFSDGFAISVCCGCFYGTVDEFRGKVKATHGDSKHGKAYQLAADLAETQIELDEEEL
jgi:hypothetical protein